MPNQKSSVSGIGFDPGHGEDLVSAVQAVTGCSTAAEGLTSSALAALVPGDPVAPWILDELEFLGRSDSTMLVFSDEDCSLCVQLRESLVELMLELEDHGVNTLYIDATPSTEFVAQRRRHMELLTATYLGDEVRLRLPDFFSPADILARPSVASSIGGITTYQDWNRQISTALVGGTVPSAIVVGSSGLVENRLIFLAGETPEQYLQRLASAATAGTRSTP